MSYSHALSSNLSKPIHKRTSEFIDKCKDVISLIYLNFTEPIIMAHVETPYELIPIVMIVNNYRINLSDDSLIKYRKHYKNLNTVLTKEIENGIQTSKLLYTKDNKYIPSGQICIYNYMNIKYGVPLPTHIDKSVYNIIASSPNIPRYVYYHEMNELLKSLSNYSNDRLTIVIMCSVSPLDGNIDELEDFEEKIKDFKFMGISFTLTIKNYVCKLETVIW